MNSLPFPKGEPKSLSGKRPCKGLCGVSRNSAFPGADDPAAYPQLAGIGNKMAISDAGLAALLQKLPAEQRSSNRVSKCTLIKDNGYADVLRRNAS